MNEMAEARGAGCTTCSCARPSPSDSSPRDCRKREFFIDNLLVRIHFTIETIWWTGLAPWEFEFPFPGSLTSTFKPQAWSVFFYLLHTLGSSFSPWVRLAVASLVTLHPTTYTLQTTLYTLHPAPYTLYPRGVE